MHPSDDGSNGSDGSWDIYDRTDPTQQPLLPPRPSPPPPLAITPTDDDDEEEDGTHRLLVEPDAASTSPPPPPSRPLCGHYGWLWTAFYSSVGLASLFLVARQRPSSNKNPLSATEQEAYALLLSNLFSWSLAPVFHLVQTIEPVCSIQPLVPLSLGLALTAHVWLWSTLLHQGTWIMIQHHFDVALVALFHSIFLGLQGYSLTLQLLAILSLTSLSLWTLWAHTLDS